MQSAPFAGAFLLSCYILLFSNSICASPIGELESNGVYGIRSIHSDQFVTIKADQYTWFSGDTLRTREAPAVLNLTTGGGFGFTDDTQATVTLTEQGRIDIEIDTGMLIYALPDSSGNLQIQVGSFTLSTQAFDNQRMNVNIADRHVGMIEHLTDGNIKIAVRSGEMHVRNGDAVRYSVSAGESVGLLDLPQQTIRTQSGAQPAPVIEIESPRQVVVGDRFRVQWQSSSPVEGDYVVIAESGTGPDEFESIVSTIEGETLNFNAPGNPGSYEIRFIDAETGEVRHYVALDVVGSAAAGYGWDQVTGILFSVGIGALAVELIDDVADDGADPVPVSP